MAKGLCKNCKSKPRSTGKFCSVECRVQWISKGDPTIAERIIKNREMRKLREVDDTKTCPCDRCGESMPAYYTLSLLTRGLWIRCKNCGTHAAPFVGGLDLPERPSKHYLKNKDKMPSLIHSASAPSPKQAFIPKVITRKVIIPNYNKEEVMRTHGQSLTTEQKIAIIERNKHIKELARQGFTHAQIAKHYDLSKFTVKEIIGG